MTGDRPIADGGRRSRLLVLTPAADLYGSDRSLLVALPALQSVYDVTLVSAADGPLLAEAERLGVECVITADWALRRRMLHPRAARATVRQVRHTLAVLRRLHAERPFIGIYANTIANAALPFLKRAVPAPWSSTCESCPATSQRSCAPCSASSSATPTPSCATPSSPPRPRSRSSRGWPTARGWYSTASPSRTVRRNHRTMTDGST